MSSECLKTLFGSNVTPDTLYVSLRIRLQTTDVDWSKSFIYLSGMWKENELVQKKISWCKVTGLTYSKRFFPVGIKNTISMFCECNFFSFDKFQVRVAFHLNLKISTIQLR